MKKTVTRKWKNKKTGQTVTKTYTYEDRKGYVLVDKKGRVKTNVVNEFKAAIDANTGYSSNEKRMLKADLDNYIRTRAGKTNRPLTTTGFMGHIEDDKIDRMFVNLGMSVEEVAQAYGLNPADIRDPSNWNGDVLTIDGKSYKYQVNYRNAVLEEI